MSEKKQWSAEQIKECARLLVADRDMCGGAATEVYTDYRDENGLAENAVLRNVIFKIADDAWNESRRAAGARIDL